MKRYHTQTYEKLGFDVILTQLSQRVSSEEARESALAIEPASDPQVILPELQRVEEFRNILEFEDQQPSPRIPAVSKLIQKLSLAGNWLSLDELSKLLTWLEAIQELRKYLKQRAEVYPTLHELINGHAFSQGLISRISSLFDNRGNLRNDASPALASIRKEINSRSNELRSTLYRLMRRAQEQGWSNEQEIVLRNDRLVIPLRAEAKNQLAGFVQDVSQTGNTVYVEPAEALPLNNRIRELHIEERNEIIRILTEVTTAIAEHYEELQTYRETMIQVDLIRGKARLAQTLGAILPTVEPKGKDLHLRQAYYPLLQLKAQQEDFEVIPLDLKLDPNHRIMVISGPNAGGKSVSLKTVGLLQLMLQSGMLVPVNEGSVFRLFDSLFLDIGDEQSVDTDLSTYTSRLFAWRQMGDQMSKNSLFLIDEFGSGTDPKQGGAIAEAFLERFVIQGAFGVITTHYGNLKDYAELTEGIINAAMQFDTKELRPTYRILDGMPGRSYAFEMAKRVGVHHTVLRRAKRKVGGDELDVEQLRKELERKSLDLEKALQENKQRQQKLDHLLERYEAKDLQIKTERRDILNQAKREARTLIEKANRDIERTIREIREAEAEKEKTKRLRKQLAMTAPELEEDISPKAAKVKTSKKKAKEQAEEKIQVLVGEPIVIGDWVKLKSAGSHGELVEIKGKKGVVATGDLRVTIKLDQLVKIKPPKQPKVQTGTSYGGDTPMKNVRFELDVKGKRAEEAIHEVIRFIDDARLAGLNRVRILHGKGNGILREAIRQQLNELPFIQTTTDAPVDEGGAGWTVVSMN
ncbi:MAG: Smr/MutS family protein [Bacteroidota bacterium]